MSGRVDQKDVASSRNGGSSSPSTSDSASARNSAVGALDSLSVSGRAAPHFGRGLVFLAPVSTYSPTQISRPHISLIAVLLPLCSSVSDPQSLAFVPFTSADLTECLTPRRDRPPRGPSNKELPPPLDLAMLWQRSNSNKQQPSSHPGAPLWTWSGPTLALRHSTATISRPAQASQTQDGEAPSMRLLQRRSKKGKKTKSTTGNKETGKATEGRMSGEGDPWSKMQITSFLTPGQSGPKIPHLTRPPRRLEADHPRSEG